MVNSYTWNMVTYWIMLGVGILIGLWLPRLFKALDKSVENSIGKR